MNTLKLEIVTPTAKIFSGDVEMVVVPGAEGELGIFPMHIPLMTELKPGELKITQKGQETYLAVGSGFVEVTQDHVSVLTDMALAEQEINEAAAEEAVARAKEALRTSQLGGEEVATVEANLAKSLAQIMVKRRKRHS
jgi:F-type H+-transporting ATPase subunit epsilon